MKFRIAGFVYIILTFFLIPFVLISFNKEEGNEKEVDIKLEESILKPDNPIDSLN